MKKLNSFARDTSGQIIIIALFLTFFMFTLMVTNTENARLTGTADSLLRYTVERAAKDAAYRVNGQAQANGIFVIDQNKAYQAFLDSLERNLGIDPATLKSSTIRIDDFELMVYNGQTAYGSYGESHFYKTGSPTYLPTSSGFPKQFNVKGVKFDFNTPGVIVYIKATETPVFGKEKSIERVGSAVLVQNTE